MISLSMVALGLLVALAWFWLDTASVRERARHHARRLCRRLEVQLLDQTVALRRTTLAWGASGLTWKRRFSFEFTESGQKRLLGEIGMHGSSAAWVIMHGEAIGRVVSPAQPH